MDGKAKSIGASFTVTFRYAALFGGIISMMLLVANLERSGNTEGARHHVRIELSH